MKVVTPNNLNYLWKNGIDKLFIRKANIVNNLTTTAEGKVADARAVKTLKDDTIISIGNGYRSRYIQGYDAGGVGLTSLYSDQVSSAVKDFTHIHIDKICVVVNGAYVVVNDQTLAVTGSIGNNYYVHVSSTGAVNVSTSSSESGKVCIGGFHYGRIRTGSSASATTIGIVPNSIWTLLFRPIANPAAMVYIGDGTWGDIYEFNDTSTGISRYNVRPTVSKSWYTFNKLLRSFNKELADHATWVAAAEGSPAGNDGDNVNAWSKTSNTESNGCGLVANAVSNYNRCDAVGNVWEWNNELIVRSDGALNWDWYSQTDEAGVKQWMYSLSDQYFTALESGGRWCDGSHASARAVALNHWPSLWGSNVGAWGVSRSV